MTKRRTYGTGSIDKLPNGTLRGRLRYIDPLTNLPCRLVVTGRTNGEVMDKIREAQNRVAKGHPIKDSATFLRDFLDQHLGLLESERKASTVRNYRDIARCTLLPALGNVRLRDLTPSIVQLKLGGGGAKARSRALAMNVLSGAMERAVQWRLITRNPVTKLARPRSKSRAGEIHYWDAGQVRRFLAFASDHENIAMFRLALTTGARKGELLGLQWRDVDYTNKTLRIARRVDQHDGSIDTPKSGRSRTINLSQDDLDLVASLGKSSMSNHILANPGTKTLPREITKKFLRLIAAFNERAKRDCEDPLPRITFRDLRHTCATLLLAAGVPIKVVSERLGHSDISITLRVYGHLLPSMQADAADKLSALLGSPLS